MDRDLHVVFGTHEAVEQVLAACGWKINTAFIERINLSFCAVQRQGWLMTAGGTIPDLL